MKIARIGGAGEEVCAVVDAAGTYKLLPPEFNEALKRGPTPKTIDDIRRFDISGAPSAAASRLGSPVATPGKFVAIGLNYSDHAKESGMAIPSEPVVFMKATSCIVGPNDPIILPVGSQKTDWEVELGIVIGTSASYVSEAEALDYVAGYLLVNDVSEREYQNERGGTWDKGKGCDTFGPLGPWFVTADEVPDPQALDLWLDVNGEPAQRGNTATMIFSCAEIISYVSRFMTLLPGDIITTGTPPGVGMGKKPPMYLKAGDLLTLGISGLGEQRQEVLRHPLDQG